MNEDGHSVPTEQKSKVFTHINKSSISTLRSSKKIITLSNQIITSSHYPKIPTFTIQAFIFGKFFQCHGLNQLKI